MSAPKALVFDLNGTVIDDMRVHNQVWTAMLDDLGVNVSEDQFFKTTAGMTNPQIIRHYLGDETPEDRIKELSETKEAKYREIYAEFIEPMPGLKELLQAAKQNGVPCGLATSAPKKNIDFALEHTGLRDSFDVIVGGDEITHGKPHPEIYLTTAEKLGVDPEECAAFEDAPRGIESAVNAKMRVFVLTTVLTDVEAQQLEGIEEIRPDFLGLAERWYS
ncbi:MAG: HAD family hydrolase [Fimbriimonadaceae bacterium]